MVQDVLYPSGTVKEVGNDVVVVLVAGKPNFDLSRLAAPVSGSSQIEESGFPLGHSNRHHPGGVEPETLGWQGSSMTVCFGRLLREAGKHMGVEL